MDGNADDAGDGAVWLTYAELAVARGVTKRTAIRMTQRHRWRRQPGNDGMIRVLVPPGDTVPRQPSATAGDVDRDGELTPFHARALAALETAIATMAAAHAAEVATLRDRLTEGEVASDQARAEATDAARAAADLRQREAAWWRQGRWARVRAAWRGQ